MELCRNCKDRPVEIKSRHLCKKCYRYLYWRGFIDVSPPKKYHKHLEFNAEMEFKKNYFIKKEDYIFQPATFNLGIVSYRPDFYDVNLNVWIEVVGTREAYRQNKRKYSLFRYMYPGLKFELRAPCGVLIEEPVDGKSMKWPESIRQIQIDRQERRKDEKERIMVVNK